MDTVEQFEIYIHHQEEEQSTRSISYKYSSPGATLTKVFYNKFLNNSDWMAALSAF